MSFDRGRLKRLFDNGISPWRETLEEIVNQGTPLPTGVPFLDHLLEGGLYPGVLNVVAGYTHSGKTLLARTVIWNNKDKRILYVVADEDRRQITLDLAATALGLRSYEVRNDLAQGRALAGQVDAVLMEHFPRTFLPTEDLLGATPSDVCSIIDQATRHWGAPPELIVFDHLGCLIVDGDGDSPVQGLVHTRIHKALCRQFSDSTWLVISQLNRPPSSAKPMAPTLSRMFGGGEAAIDGCAIGVWRWPEDERSEDDVDIMLNVMKAKQGRASPGGPGKRSDAGDNPSKNKHVHKITERSTIYPKMWPEVKEMRHEHFDHRDN